MINNRYLIAILVFTLLSCTSDRSESKPQQETPKALEDKSASYETGYKKRDNDLLQNLYGELVSKDNDLKRLENMIEVLNNSENDSTEVLDKFKRKNELYFNAADKHVSGINDSLLKSKMKNLLADQLKKYSEQTSGLDQLTDIIKSKNLVVQDLHVVLKVVKTLPLIDRYQKENLPQKEPLAGYIKLQDQTIGLADTLSKR